MHFRRKEITIYPDDDHKPPVGKGLNRKAQVTLDCVWPTDKTSHSPIKSLDRLKDMGYLEKLERASARIKANFIDYRPETGSWVFEVRTTIFLHLCWNHMAVLKPEISFTMS